jgi:hypothetical protein
VDFLNGSHQFLSFGLVNVDLAGAAEFGGFPEGVVQIGEGGQVLRLEIVGPQDQQFLFGLLSFLLLDGHVATEGVVVGSKSRSITCRRSLHGLELLRHGKDGFSRNTGRSWVIDAAGSVAMGFRRRCGKGANELNTIFEIKVLV